MVSESDQPKQKHTFTATFDFIEAGTGRAAVLPMPDDVVQALKEQQVKRVILHVGGLTYRRALLNDARVGTYLYLGKNTRKEAGISLGQHLAVSIWPDPDPDAIDIPEEWEELMAQDPEVARVFQQFTPGLQRSLMVYLTDAKRAETRVKRALHLAARIQSPDYYKYRKDRQG